MASPSSSPLEYLNLTKFQKTVCDLHNILGVMKCGYQESNYSAQIEGYLQVLESEYQSLLEENKQL